MFGDSARRRDPGALRAWSASRSAWWSLRCGRGPPFLL